MQLLTIANSTISGNVAGGEAAKQTALAADRLRGRHGDALTCDGRGEQRWRRRRERFRRWPEHVARYVSNSIVAANPGGDCSPAVTSAGHNIDDDTSCGFTGAGDRSGIDAKLGALGDHGGLTLTQDAAGGQPGDRHWRPRNVPDDRSAWCRASLGGGCDIGAVEVAPPTVFTSPATITGAESATVGG